MASETYPITHKGVLRLVIDPQAEEKTLVRDAQKGTPTYELRKAAENGSKEFVFCLPCRLVSQDQSCARCKGPVVSVWPLGAG